jgi:hypothetical protein
MAWLELHKIEYETKQITPEALTEFRTNGIFSLSAPVLHLAGPYWYGPDELFDGDDPNRDKLCRIFSL